LAEIPRAVAEELQELYAELNYTAGRAATALRLSLLPGAPAEELREKFEKEHVLATELWQRIGELQDRV
jgi:hypothetical protein